MNAFVLTCIVLAATATAAAILALCYAVLSAKDGYENESGFHVGKPAVAKPARSRRVLTERVTLSA